MKNIDIMDSEKALKKKMKDIVEKEYWSVIPEIKNIDKDKMFDKAFALAITAENTSAVVDNELLFPFYERFRKNKERLYKSLNSNGSPYHQDIKVAKFTLEEADGERKFEEKYGCSSIDEYTKKLDKELLEWRANKEIFVCQFKYITYSSFYSASKVNTALTNDLSYLIMKKIIQSRKKNTYKMPHVLVDSLPTVPGKQTKVFEEEVKAKGINNSLITKRSMVYFINDHETFLSQYSLNDVKKDALYNELVALKNDDLLIFFAILEQAEPDFLESREIRFSISDIMNELKYVRNGANYQKIRDAIYRLYYIQISLINKKDGKSLSYKVFDNLYTGSGSSKNGEVMDTSDDESIGNEITPHALKSNDFKVLVNIEIMNQLIDEKTTEIYKDNIDSLKESSARILIFSLEKERWALHLAKNTQMKKVVDIYFFRRIFHFINERKTRNYKLIEKALDDIINQGITLKKYVRTGDYFELEFYPPSEDEDLNSLLRTNKLNATRMLKSSN